MKIVNEQVLNWFRNEPCEMCGKSPPSDPHHLWTRGQGGNRLDVPWNLVSLCRRCHQNVQGVKAFVPELCRMATEREVWILQRAPKEFAEKFAKALEIFLEARYI